MTEHEKRVEWLLQEIAFELADLVFYAEKRNGNWDSARSTMELYKRNINDIKGGLNHEIMTKEILQRQKKRFCLFGRGDPLGFPSCVYTRMLRRTRAPWNHAGYLGLLSSFQPGTRCPSDHVA